MAVGSWFATTPLRPLDLVQVSQNTLAGVEGIYIGDRTSSAGPVFQPASENIKMMLQPPNPPPATLNPNTSFAYYTGSWGIDLMQTNALDVTCFFDNLTVEGKWPKPCRKGGCVPGRPVGDRP